MNDESESELRLTAAEHGILCEVLRRSLDEARIEARHTDTPAFRAGIELERALMRGILAKLGHGGRPPESVTGSQRRDAQPFEPSTL